MKQREILERAIKLYNEPIDDHNVIEYIEGFYGQAIEELDGTSIYSLGYGTALTDLAAACGIDVKAFLDSRGETQEIINDGEGPSRSEVEKLRAVYEYAQEEEHRVA